MLMYLYLYISEKYIHAHMYILMYAHNSYTHICACAYIDTLCTCIQIKTFMYVCWTKI